MLTDTQLPLFPPYPVGGATYVPELDEARLGAQQRRVLDLMKDGQWRSLRAIAQVTGDPEASISARLRQVNQWPISEVWRMEHRRVGDPKRGHWEYRVIPAGTQLSIKW